MKEPSPQQLTSSEHSSSLDLCLGPGVQTGMDLLQPPGPVQLQHFVVHRADKVLQELQSPSKRLRLLLATCRRSQVKGSEVTIGQWSKVRGHQTLYITFSVVQYPLDQDWVLCDSLCHQQDALLDTMTTQQRTTADTLSVMGWTEREG